MVPKIEWKKMPQDIAQAESGMRFALPFNHNFSRAVHAVLESAAQTIDWIKCIDKSRNN